MTGTTLPCVGVGASIDPSRIVGVGALITQAEERHVEQMLQIAFLMAEGVDTAEAEDGLRQIELLLVTMRLHARLSRDGQS